MKKILIIEDDPNLREAVIDLLSIKGYQLEIAEDGFTGYTKAKVFQPDLILSDIVMPRIDGFDMLSLIKDDDTLNTIPFIFISGKSEKESFRKAMNLGANDFLVKPFAANELYEAVHSRLAVQSEKKVKVPQAKPVHAHAGQVVAPAPASAATGKLAVPTIDGLDMIELCNVIRCEAQRAYAKFYFKDGRTRLVSKSMKTFEQELCANNFMKVHRSHIVNLNHVVKYVKGSGGYLVLSDKSSISVSPTYKARLLETLT